jgi:hypothetical protein
MNMPITATVLRSIRRVCSVDVEQPATSCHYVRRSAWDLVAPSHERAGPAKPTQGSARLVGLDLERAQA